MSGIEYQVTGVWPRTDGSNRITLQCVPRAAIPPVNNRDSVIELVRDVSRVRRMVGHDMDWPATRRYQLRDPRQLGRFHRHVSETSRGKEKPAGQGKAGT